MDNKHRLASDELLTSLATLQVGLADQSNNTENEARQLIEISNYGLRFHDNFSILTFWHFIHTDAVYTKSERCADLGHSTICLTIEVPGAGLAASNLGIGGTTVAVCPVIRH